MMGVTNAPQLGARGRLGLGCASLALFWLLVPGHECVAQSGSSKSEPGAADPVYFETGIASVALLSSDSGRQFIDTNGLGTTSDDGFIHNFYSNASDSEVLDLIFHPGDVRHSFSEVILFRPDCFPLGAAPTKSRTFVSSKGIKLGLRAADVRRILGKPHGVKTGKSGKVTYKYFCDDPAKCPSLAKYNTPTYTAVAQFASGRLVKYSFGYDYP